MPAANNRYLSLGVRDLSAGSRRDAVVNIDDLLNGATALVVDGGDERRTRLRGWLVDEGMRVSEAGGGVAGIEAAARLPDIVIVGADLPDVPSRDVTAALKGNPLTRHIPVVQLTPAAIPDEARIDGLRSGADSALAEPLDRGVLVATVIAHLRHSELSRQLELALSLDHAGVYDWAVGSGRVRWSESLERLHGLEAGGFGETFDDFLATVHRDDRHRVRAELDAATRDGDDVMVSFRFVRADSTIGWMESHGRVFRDADGAAVRVLGVAIDVSDRVRERRRIEQLHRLASALTAARTATRVIEIVASELDGTGITVSVTDGEPAAADVVFSSRVGTAVIELIARPGEGDAVDVQQATAIGELAATALDRALRFEAERSNAVAFQRALLPATTPEVPGWWIDAEYAPAAENDRLGGDFFDVIELDDSFVVVIGDVAGHGLGATAQMGTVRTLLRTLVASNRGEPEAVVWEARALFDQVCGAGSPFVTACVARCRPGGDVTICVAGHPPPVVRRHGIVAAVDVVPGPPLGTFADVEDTSTVVSVGVDDWIAFYTDGVLERRDRPLDIVVAELGDELSRAVTAAAFIRVGDAPLDDDRAVVLVRRTGLG